MARVKPPIVPEQPVPVVPEDGLRRLLATCEGKSFEERRYTALILLLVDVGPRRAELMGLRVSDVDFDLDVLLVLGKGRRERALPFGRATAPSSTAVRLVQADHWTTFVLPPPITSLTRIPLGSELCNSADRRAIPAVSGYAPRVRRFAAVRAPGIE